jgi:hypothetical protein
MVGNGKLSRIWNGVCVSSTPLRLCFPRLYAICENREILIANYGDMGWQLSFRRMLSSKEYAEWLELQEMLNSFRSHNRRMW